MRLLTYALVCLKHKALVSIAVPLMMERYSSRAGWVSWLSIQIILYTASQPFSPIINDNFIDEAPDC